MTSSTNRQFKLAARPQGVAKRSDFDFVDEPIPSPGDGEVLIRNTMFSIDPYQRNLMGNGSSEWPPLAIGDTMEGPTVALVEESHHPDFRVGDAVQSWTGWRDYAVSNGTDLRKLDAAVAPLSTALGPLGLTGFAAWYGMTKVHDFKPGGTLVVTGAAGAIGSTAAQLGKLRGLHVVGVAGGPNKVAYLLDELGLDAAIDYKGGDLPGQIARALPNGINAFFENVGGPIFPLLMERFNLHAKMTVCGTISNYNDTELPTGVDHLPRLISLIHYRFVSIMAYATPFVMDKMPEFLAEMTPLVTNGQIKYREEYVDGFDKLPETLISLYDGTHSGSKLIVRAD